VLFFILIGLGINLKDKAYGIVSEAKAIPQQQQAAPIQPVQVQPPVEPVPVQQVDHELAGEAAGPSVLDDQTKAALISAVRYADEVEISAGQTLNTDILTNAFTGEALRNERLNIENLKQNNQLQYSTLNSQQFLYFKTQSGWPPCRSETSGELENLFLFLAYKRVPGVLPDHDAPQTIFLVKAANGWIVETIVFDDTPQTRLVPCK
jgi:hypothetical protein